MRIDRRVYLLLGLVAVVAAVGTGAFMASAAASSGGAPGRIDDGAELLELASISLEDAIAAAQASADGALGEVDLETYQGSILGHVEDDASDARDPD